MFSHNPKRSWSFGYITRLRPVWSCLRDSHAALEPQEGIEPSDSGVQNRLIAIDDSVARVFENKSHWDRLVQGTIRTKAERLDFKHKLRTRFELVLHLYERCVLPLTLTERELDRQALLSILSSGNGSVNTKLCAKLLLSSFLSSMLFRLLWDALSLFVTPSPTHQRALLD